MVKREANLTWASQDPFGVFDACRKSLVISAILAAMPVGASNELRGFRLQRFRLQCA